jgi:hypothetical protein
MDLTTEENAIVRRASAELGKSLAAAGVPDERWSIVTLAVVADLARQALDLHEPAPTTERESWQR